MNGFVAKRRGTIEHLRDGRLTLQQYGAYDAMIGLADKSSGIWTGSAKALSANCGAGDVTERQARHILESLEAKGYIRRFATSRARGNYPILINKYEVSFGAQKGMRLNAQRTSDWRHPVYESCLVHCAEQGARDGAQRAPFQQGQWRQTKGKDPPAKPTPIADPRHKIAFDSCFEAYRGKYSTRPTWGEGKEKLSSVF